MKKYQLTEKLSTEAQNHAFLVGAVSGGTLPPQGNRLFKHKQDDSRRYYL